MRNFFQITPFKCLTEIIIAKKNPINIAYPQTTMLEGLQTWILNYAKESRFMASLETDKIQIEEYLDIAERLEWLSKNKPRTFHDALQMVWIFHAA